MKIAFGISWNDSKKGGALLVALAVSLTLASVPVTTYQELSRSVSVIVRVEPGSGTAPQEIVEALGGKVGRELEIINGFEAKIPAHRLEELDQSDSITSVTLNSRVHLQHAVEGFDALSDAGSVFNVARATKADKMWRRGFTGQGVDIAMIDSGIVPVNGLRTPGKIINGPDLSFESQAGNLRYLDTYGHGTHVAGIMAGRDDELGSSRAPNHDAFSGIAPDARVVSVKVADATGATDVSQVLAGIDWVVQHRHDNGMNIRVLNLSFGTDGVQSYILDPLTYAAEVAWHHGIVVVVSAGNSQFGTGRLNNPAYDPFVIAVGASDPGSTPEYLLDDTVPGWSARSAGRTVDLVAPGKSVVSLRDPNSFIDTQYPAGRVNSRFFRGSGTSQAAAVVSGAAALVLDQRPWLTPDQVKSVLKRSATPLPLASATAQGDGALDLARASREKARHATQQFPRATGLGSLEASRGSVHVTDANGVQLTGEQDIFGAAWDANSWSANSWSANSWSGGTWNGNAWAGEGWQANSWSANSWSANSWSANSWSANSWSGLAWSANSWSANSWSANSWSANSWSANSWSANSWSANSWSANSWSSSYWG